MWTETDSFKTLLLRKVKTHTSTLSSATLHKHLQQQCRRTSYSGYPGHQSNAISMYYIITVYTSPGIKLY